MIRGLEEFVKEVFSFLFPIKVRYMVMQEVYLPICLTFSLLFLSKAAIGMTDIHRSQYLFFVAIFHFF
ncbi:hypothetical protein WPAURP_02560 [Wolbachia pipientis]